MIKKAPAVQVWISYGLREEKDEEIAADLGHVPLVVPAGPLPR